MISNQKLILPINKCAFSAGYKNKAYLSQMKFGHYGVDLYSMTGEKTVYACGNGKVVACGMDGSTEYSALGNCVVIVYKDVVLHNGKVMDLACRMFHFGKIFVRVGDKVTSDTVIGNYGNTGGTTINGGRMGAHLHIEFDSDVVFPQYAVGIRNNGKIIKKGYIDSTIDPSDIWFIKKSKPDSQTITGIYSGWFSDNDINLPEYEEKKPKYKIEENKIFDTMDQALAYRDTIKIIEIIE